MTVIEQLKTEIERLLKSQIRHFDAMGGPTNFDIATLGWVLEKISTLESEKPSKGLEEEIERYLSTEWVLDEDLNKDEPIYIYGTWEDLKILARHFAKWGAEHLADTGKTSPKDLEEAAEEYEKKHTYQRYDGGGFTPEYDATLAEAVIFGAKLQKDQMMKEAVEGVVERAPSGKAISVKHEGGGDYWAFGNEVAKQFNLGDKVRIIIVKED